MSTTKSTSKPAPWITIAIVIGIGIWIFKGCAKQSEQRDLEMMGRGMLEARRIDTSVLPQDAGKNFYYMVSDLSSGEYTEEDVRGYIGVIRTYQAAYLMLRKKGISDNTIRHDIPEHKIFNAMRQSDPQKAIDDLARQYD